MNEYNKGTINRTIKCTITLIVSCEGTISASLLGKIRSYS
jgi:hypothetical protein